MNRSKRKNFKGGRRVNRIDAPIGTKYKVVIQPGNEKNKELKVGDIVTLAKHKTEYSLATNRDKMKVKKGDKVFEIGRDKVTFYEYPEPECPPCADKKLTKDDVSEYFKNASGKELFELLGEEPPPKIPEFIPEEQ